VTDASNEQQLSRDGLIVTFSPDDDKLAVVFTGKSDSRSPSVFFEEMTPVLLEHAKGKRVFLDFRTLEYMNSATVSPVLSLVRTLDGGGVETTLLFDLSCDWQRINSRCMRVITKNLAHVKVTENAA
jgi:hypothetical protein